MISCVYYSTFTKTYVLTDLILFLWVLLFVFKYDLIIFNMLKSLLSNLYNLCDFFFSNKSVALFDHKMPNVESWISLIKIYWNL